MHKKTDGFEQFPCFLTDTLRSWCCRSSVLQPTTTGLTLDCWNESVDIVATTELFQCDHVVSRERGGVIHIRCHNSFQQRIIKMCQFLICIFFLKSHSQCNVTQFSKFKRSSWHYKQNVFLIMDLNSCDAAKVKSGNGICKWRLYCGIFHLCFN